MRYLILALTLCLFLRLQAQKTYADELQLTETRFALESQIHGLKWGFLHNMDTVALGFNNKGFVNLYTAWKDRPEQSANVLQWKPTALWSSDDGLFGLTTGPYFTKGAKDSTPMAHGYFFTIWQRVTTIEPYKFVLDAGVQMTPGVVPLAFISTPVVRSRIAKAGTGSKELSTIQQVRSSQTVAFCYQSANESLGLALKKYMQDKSFLLVSDYGKLPITAVSDVAALNRKIDLRPIHHKDLSAGCYYEWGQFRSADDPAATSLSGCYVQVWQVQSSKPLLLAAVYKFDQPLKP